MLVKTRNYWNVNASCGKNKMNYCRNLFAQLKQVKWHARKRQYHVNSTPDYLQKYENCRTQMKRLKTAIPNHTAILVADS